MCVFAGQKNIDTKLITRGLPVKAKVTNKIVGDVNRNEPNKLPNVVSKHC